MKLFVLALLFAVAGAIELRGVQQVHAPAPAPGVAGASTDEILAEIKHRVEVCGESGTPLAGLSLDDLFAELKKREADKVCGPAPAPGPGAGGPGGPGAGGPGGPGADGPGGAPTPAPTTTTTTPCPDNFMDEIVDQANPEFDRFDTNKDGCLEDSEMTVTLKRQIEMARHRDYYWIRRNITNAARNLTKHVHKDHEKADENESGCLNREELDVIHHAVCDCPTQFMFMDHNADGKISQQEAATYVSAHMVHADLNYVTLAKIFKAADVDSSKYLSLKEFCEAGPKYKGDGKDWLVSPGPAPGPAPAF